jgi:hypothetical protein
MAGLPAGLERFFIQNFVEPLTIERFTVPVAAWASDF